MGSHEDWTVETRSNSGWFAIGTLAAGLFLVGCGASEVVDAIDEFENEISQLDEDSEGAPASGSESFSGDGASVLEIELGEPTTFTMPEGQSDATANFEVPAGSIVTVSAQAPDSNRGELFVEVRTPDSQGSMPFVIPGAEPVEQRFVTAAESGSRWGITVQGAPGASIRITVNVVSQNDAGAGTDAGGDASSPTPIMAGVALSGLVEDSDNSDWYVLALTGGDMVGISLNMLDDTGVGGVGADLQFNGQTVVNTSVFPGGEEAATYIFAADQSGDAFLEVNGSGVYNFEITITSQDDGRSGGDAGADQGSATAAEMGTISGVLGDADLSDVYQLTLPADAVVMMELSQPVGDLGGIGIRLEHNGGAILSADVSPGATEATSTIVLNEPDAVVFVIVSGAGTYDIVLSAATQSDGGDGTGDAGGDAASAKEIATDASFDGWISRVDMRDFYTFTPTVSGPLDVAISLDPDSRGSTTISIRNAATTRIGEFKVAQGGSGNETVQVEAGQTYTLSVQDSQQVLRYTLTLTPG